MPQPFGNLPIEQQGQPEGPIATESFLHEALSMLEDINTCNQKLAQAQLSHMPPLTLTQKAELMPILSPEDMQNPIVNNFGGFFRYHVGVDDNDQRIPVTESQVDGFLDGSFDLRFFSGHNLKPAFWRMLVLFPDFTKKLVLKASQPQNFERTNEKLAEDLYAAYQIMTQMVNIDDLGVIQNGEVDKEYLFR